VNLVVGASPAIVTFTAPLVPTITTLTFQLTVSNAVGTSTSTVTVTVNPAASPTAQAGAPQTIQETTAAPTPLVTLHGNGSTAPRGLPLTYHWSQTAGPLVVLSANDSAAAAQPTFTAPALAPGAASTVLNFTLVVTSSVGAISAPSFTTVTVLPPADVVTITGVEYRIGKQRLTIDATSSVVSPTVTLALQAFATAAGLKPGGTLTNLGGGVYQLILVGVPQPSNTVTVTSTAGGTATSGITRLRQ
jgi:PKD repeat protein